MIVVISEDVQRAFRNFIFDKAVLALPLALKDSSLHALPTVYAKGSGLSFQNDLNLLDDTLDPRIPLYLVLRRGESVTAITFVPFRAPVDELEVAIERALDDCGDIDRVGGQRPPRVARLDRSDPVPLHRSG